MMDWSHPGPAVLWSRTDNRSSTANTGTQHTFTTAALLNRGFQISRYSIMLFLCIKFESKYRMILGRLAATQLGKWKCNISIWKFTSHSHTISPLKHKQTISLSIITICTIPICRTLTGQDSGQCNSSIMAGNVWVWIVHFMLRTYYRLQTWFIRCFPFFWYSHFRGQNHQTWQGFYLHSLPCTKQL